MTQSIWEPLLYCHCAPADIIYGMFGCVCVCRRKQWKSQHAQIKWEGTDWRQPYNKHTGTVSQFETNFWKISFLSVFLYHTGCNVLCIHAIAIYFTTVRHRMMLWHHEQYPVPHTLHMPSIYTYKIIKPEALDVDD